MMKLQKQTMTLALITTAIAATLISAWGLSLFTSESPAASLPWQIYDQALYLSGFLSIGFMSITMMLAMRPAWLESPLKGLDQIYRLHKWSGILAVVFAALHWLIEMGDDVIKSIFGRAGRLHDQVFSGFIDMMRDAAEDIGEWAVYLLFVMLVLSLWKRFPYNLWRYLHRAMPALYLLLVFHSAWLAPLSWWQQPIGILIALLMMGGSIASLLSLRGKVGQARQVKATLLSVSDSIAGIIEVKCQLENTWKGHRPGQFVLITFDRLEGSHPFTIASSDNANQQITLHIKALGDYTNRLKTRLSIGQAITVEGPYGRFNFKPRKPNTVQTWVAAGIGITPFLSKLEALQNQTNESQTDQPILANLHYCTRDSVADPFVSHLQSACSDLPNIQLHIYDSGENQRLTAEVLLAIHGENEREAMEVWFCGPSAFANSLESSLRERLNGRLYFHKEAFEFR